VVLGEENTGAQRQRKLKGSLISVQTTTEGDKDTVYSYLEEDDDESVNNRMLRSHHNSRIPSELKKSMRKTVHVLKKTKDMLKKER
jgi:hypothetical protein